MKKIKLLLAEDEASLGMIVSESLEARNFEVTLVENGELALQKYHEKVFDILVLDVMMPKLDGFELAQKIRGKNENIPIIFLTAKSRTEDVIEGFSMGANDYLKKPFSVEELIVRIQALVKRNQSVSSSEWHTIGAYQFNAERQLLKFREKEENLTHKEAQVLLHLYTNKNKLTDKSQILKAIWGTDDFFTARSMDVFISKLRKKLSEDESVQIINSRGLGYKLIT